MIFSPQYKNKLGFFKTHYVHPKYRKYSNKVLFFSIETSGLYALESLPLSTLLRQNLYAYYDHFSTAENKCSFYGER